MNSKKKNNSIFKWLLSLVAIFFILILFAGGAYFLFEKKYDSKIIPGVKAGKIEIGGLTKQEAREKLQNRINQFEREGIVLEYEDDATVLTPQISSISGDISYDIIKFDLSSTLNRAYNYGRNKNFLQNTLTKIDTFSNGKNIEVKAELDEKEIKKIIHKNFKKFEIRPRDAKLIISTSSPESSIDYEIQKEKTGKVIDDDKALKRLKRKMQKLNWSDVKLKDKIEKPAIHKRDCLNMDNKINMALSKTPIKLKYKDKEWALDKMDLALNLKLKKGEEGNKILVVLDDEKIQKYLEERIGPEINEEPVDARFEMEDGKVAQFKASKNGIKLEKEKTTEKIKQLTEGELSTSTIEVATKKVESKISIDNANNLGIKEIIGTGHSDFSGSPSNRVHNIRTGAESLNGIIIKPDEEFSLVSALGKINAESGYKPELVIKGNETVPEYGGGLCQIGTTIFRTALNSGLKITERRNHSYRVSYYEPAGTDATIYNPRPDFKFKNDTPSNILIQYRIEGRDLYFDFWGTDDGRLVTTTDPTIYNITNPGPTKMIETTDLEPGQKKCTESAHKGADAYFDYKIKYPDGETRERRFHSHYTPWRGVCLIGAEKQPTEEEAKDNEDSNKNKTDKKKNAE